MEFDIIIAPRAQKEIENAIDFYAVHSLIAAKYFIDSLSECYHKLSANPYFAIRYRNIRGIKLRKFPFSLYFVINENRNIVKILSYFHNRKNPSHRPK